MDKYHIYEEVGSGQHSQVFKGREKMDIEYVAIKRVEKSRMESIVKEVQVRHVAHIRRYNRTTHVRLQQYWYCRCSGRYMHSCRDSTNASKDPQAIDEPMCKMPRVRAWCLLLSH